MTRSFPGPGQFVLGAATAAFQVEGASTEDGRGPSIWDTFCTVPGAVVDGSDGSVACDSYHRLDEDLELVDGLGVDYYRFSLAWPRIVPEGTGRVEPRGLDYYDRLVDGLLARGLAPSATLYHWDLPQPLEDAGGWLVRKTAEAFADYAGVVAERLADRVELWATLNEPWCAAYLGYAAGVHAPGRREGGRAHLAAHHLNVAHALGAQRLRDAGAQRVGVVLNLAPVRSERPEADDLRDGVDAVRNRVWLDPLVDGAYGDAVLAVAPELAEPGAVRDDDLAAIRGSADWLGVNYYTPVRVDLPGEGEAGHPEGGAYPGVAPFGLVVDEPRTDIGWEVDATGLTDVLVDTHARTGLPIVVTENGAAYADGDRTTGPDGDLVDDQDRIAYVRDHVAALGEARRRGADVRGYFYWTLLDNFEWAEGYTKTFGLVEVDPTDQRRTPKASYRWVAGDGGAELRRTAVAE